VEELTGAMVQATWVRGNGIELVRELQWEVGVLAEDWVERMGRRRWLTMAGRSSGGAPARCDARGEGNEAECECVSA
jgi:hypothetical protein